MIWEAARATSAAPKFFKRIIIGGPGSQEEYVDGGMGCNNPIAHVLSEAELTFPGRHVACIISIGTGQPLPIQIRRPSLSQQVLPLNVVKAMQGIATDCEESHQRMAQRFQEIENLYFRFNVDQGMQEIRLAQWERFTEVTTHTQQYTRMQEVDKKLDAAVEAMRGRQRVVSTAYLSMEAVTLC